MPTHFESANEHPEMSEIFHVILEHCISAHYLLDSFLENKIVPDILEVAATA